jgi:hypothetical protein
MGLYNAIIGAAAIVGSLAGGYLAETLGYVVSFGSAALLIGLAAAWSWRLRAAVLDQAEQRSSAQQGCSADCLDAATVKECDKTEPA